MGTLSMHTPKEIQCSACATYGHDMQDCWFLPILASGLEYIQAHPPVAQNALQRYRQQHHPANRQSTQKVISQAVYEQFGEEHDEFELNEFITRLTTSMLGRTDMEDPDYEHINNGSIFSMRTTQEWQRAAPLKRFNQSSIHWPSKYGISCGTVSHHEWKEAQQPSLDEDRVLQNPTTTASSECITISLTTIQQRDLADTGASVSATGMKEILHHQFTTHTARYEITGYDGNTTKAAGHGYAHVRNDTTNGIDKILFVYSPSISGCWHDIFVGTQCTHESWHTSMDTEGNTLNEFGMDNVLQ